MPLMFCDTSQEHLEYLNWSLMWFKAISEIKIKLEKSELISVADDNGVKVLAAFWGCNVWHLPSISLGLPLGAPFKSTSI